MIRKYKLLIVSFLSCLVMKAQNGVPQGVCHNVKRGHTLARVTVADVLEDAYDIHYVKFDLSATNTSRNISGSVTTIADCIVPSLNDYVFELTNSYSIDSVKLNGQLATPSVSLTKVTVPFPVPVIVGQSFTAQVFYHGSPPASGDMGVRNEHSTLWNRDVSFTLSEPYSAREWWPCKQSLTDKIDSADIWITVGQDLMAGSNGLLMNTTPLSGGNTRYEWKSATPIDYYLLSFAVAPYIDYTYYVHFNATDSMPVQNFVYDNPQTLPFFKNRIDSVGAMILHFSDLFGRYPFWKEKYGHCLVPLGGGMEHQTMTTLGNFNTTLTAHELAHQWFGDNVTCGSWHDIWLNEGFASYAEYLYVDHFRSGTDAFNYMTDMHNEVMSELGGSVYVDDTTDEGRIFSSRLSYKKGASVIHTLRSVFNDDNLFFQTLQQYQQQYKNSTALTDDFKSIATQVHGHPLDTFFNQWISGEGYPFYAASWNQVDSNVSIRLFQFTSMPGSVPLFSLPVELKLTSPQGDTVVRIYNNQSVQNYSFIWPKSMSGMTIDPNDWIINRDLGVVKDITLNIGEVKQEGVIVAPNPAGDAWYISGLVNGSVLQLYDLNGTKLWSKIVNEQPVILLAADLRPGVYFLKIYNHNGTSALKLIKE